MNKSKQMNKSKHTPSLTQRLTPRRPAKAGLIAAILAVSMTAAAFDLFAKSAPPAKPGGEPVIQAAAPITAIPQKPRYARGKTVGTEPSGIALPADSQAAAPLEDSAPAAASKPAETSKPASEEKTPPAKTETGKPTTSKTPPRKTAVKKPSAKDDDIIEKDAKRPRLTGLMAEAYTQIEKQNFAAAVEIYDKALDKDENDNEAWKGKCYALQQMETPEAVAELKKMIEHRPQSAPAHAALGQILTQRGEREQALKPLQRAVELDPGNDTYRANLAILHDRMGHDAEAIDLYKKIKPPVPYAIKQRLESLKIRAKTPATP